MKLIKNKTEFEYFLKHDTTPANQQDIVVLNEKGDDVTDLMGVTKFIPKEYPFIAYATNYSESCRNSWEDIYVIYKSDFDKEGAL